MKGYYFDKPRGRYRARIIINGVSKSKSFKTEIEAKQWYLDQNQKLSRFNFTEISIEDRILDHTEYRNGKLYYTTNWCNVKEGDEVGYTDSKGYLKLMSNGKVYSLHRLIWLKCHGTWPDDVIDHINGNKADNRIENLRDVKPELNNRNTKIYKTNKSGIMGVYRYRSGWRVTFRVNNKQKCFGVHKDFFEACCIRKSLEVKHEYHENHGRRP